MKSRELFVALGLATAVSLTDNTVTAGEYPSAIAKRDSANTSIMEGGIELFF